MKSVVLIPLVWMAFLLSGCKKSTRNSSEKSISISTNPNIIWIMADDLGYGDLGCYGQEAIATPNIDKMALEGLKFTQCYAGSPVCAPSRSVLMTGQHTGRTHVRGNGSRVVEQPPPYNRVPLRPEDTTVAQLLKKAGYVTGITGKWGLGEPGTTGVPNLKGFDEWLGFLNQNHAHNYYPEYIWDNEQKMPLPGNANGAEGQYVHDFFIDFALDFIQAHKDTTFFLYYSIILPHAEYEIPDSELAPFKDREWDDDAKVQAAMVTRLDREVGEIMNLLRVEQIDDRTLVFFCSDNGAARRWEGVFDSSGQLRGRKRDMYEGGIRTPMIARWPGKVAAGEVSDFPWYFADFLPTMADLTGVVPSKSDGISVLPVLLGEEIIDNDRFMYWEFHEGGFNQAARWKNWKAVRSGLDGTVELYDLETDEVEAFDIANAHPDVVDVLTHYLDTARTRSYYWPVEGE